MPSRTKKTLKPAASAARLQEIWLDDLLPNPDQPRKIFDEDALSELAASIEKSGLIQPIVAVENADGFTIVAGERRFRAVRSLGFETVPVLVIEDGVSDELALIENVQREDLHPLEEAEAMERLMQRHGYTQEELAAVIGKARPTVANTLKLNQLPERIKEECAASSTVTKSLLFEIVQMPEDERLKFWDQVKDGGVTVRKARRRRKGHQRQPLAQIVLKAGNDFRKGLRALVAEAEVDDRQIAELRRIHLDVGELLESLDDS